MRIGMLSYPGLAGCGIAAVELGHELAERGHQVHFIACEPPFRLGTDLDHISVHLVRPSNFDLFRHPDPILPLAAKTAEVISLHELDVLHAHYAVPFGVVALLARQLSARSPRIVTTLHGTDITILGRDARYREIVRHCIEGSDAVTAVSKPLIDDAAGLVGAKKTIHLVPNFPISRRMSGSRAALRSEIDVGPDDFLLLHMSNLRPLKRVADILGALARCRTDPKLMILAGGDVQECETTAEKLGVSDSLRVHSRVAEVEPYIGISDAGVYASESEQCSLAILETMSFAKPVIASNSGGTPEVIGETGLLFEVGDVDALAGHIDFLVTNPERCRELGLAARQRTERAFPRDVIVNRYLELYSG